jgi:hypothetical protein
VLALEIVPHYHTPIIFKETLIERVRDLFTCTSKVKRKFYNNIKLHLIVKKKEKKRKKVPAGLEPANS